MLRLRFATFAVLVSGLTISAIGSAQPGGKKGPGRGENFTGIITVLTQKIPVPSGPYIAGLYSDQDSNIRYYPSALDGAEDPDNPGALLDDGDCVVIVTPAADGVDQGKLVLFAPFGPNACTVPGPLRQLKVLGSGEDLAGDDDPDDPDPDTASELIDARFGCNDVFPSDSPIPGGITSTSCSLEVREYDEQDEFERTWIIEWPSVSITHWETDLRQLDAETAEVFELVAPTKGKGKKDKELRRTDWPLAFKIKIRRVREP